MTATRHRNVKSMATGFEQDVSSSRLMIWMRDYFVRITSVATAIQTGENREGERRKKVDSYRTLDDIDREILTA